jgi:hypothetical protein
MNSIKYRIVVPMAGSTDGFELCRCDNPEMVSEVIKILLLCGPDGPVWVKVEVYRD